ncbi:unnamed protein product [Linum trigynum]|uniref:Uncharacterized protein n=1 Tax=Linum trigynum TaxID=586398 RepID=A0AAV2DEW2_9ROSI
MEITMDSVNGGVKGRVQRLIEHSILETLAALSLSERDYEESIIRWRGTRREKPIEIDCCVSGRWEGQKRLGRQSLRKGLWRN